MAYKNGTHKQSKYLTIMLIPDSSANVKSIRIPHWFFLFFGVLFSGIMCITVFFSARVETLGNLLNNSSLQLEKSLEEKKEIENERITLLSAFEREKAELTNEYSELTAEKDIVISKLDDFARSISELQYKSQVLEELKRDIVNTLDQLSALDLPVSLDETLLETDFVPVGGPYIPDDDIASRLLYEFDVCLSSDIRDMQLLKDATDSLLTFINARPLGWPVSSRVINSEFGSRQNPFGGQESEIHTGIDIQASYGSDVHVTADGIVSFSSWNSNGYGYLVIVEHKYGYSTYYAHNSKLLVKEGDDVKRGEIIALSGNSGRSLGAHCHYEIRLNDTSLNPLGYLEELFD